MSGPLARANGVPMAKVFGEDPLRDRHRPPLVADGNFLGNLLAVQGEGLVLTVAVRERGEFFVVIVPKHQFIGGVFGAVMPCK